MAASLGQAADQIRRGRGAAAALRQLEGVEAGQLLVELGVSLLEVRRGHGGAPPCAARR